MRRVTVDLPFVPVTETTGIRRTSSRIHEGGVERASAILASQRARARACAPVRCARGAGDTERDARSNAASAMSRARSAPCHGQVTVQWPVSDDRCTAHGPPASPCSRRSRRAQATRSATGSGQSRAATVRPRWSSDGSPSDRRPCHACVRPTETSTLTTGTSR